jgi:hypothetical protein
VIDSAQSLRKDTFIKVATSFVQKACDMAKKAETKSSKIQAKFMRQSDLKTILKEIKMTPEEASNKRKRRSQNPQEYEGQWKEDRSEGWGCSIYKSGDKYKGNFKADKMEGRGQYFFGDPSTQSLLYIGEFHENTFQGLGKMIFSDNTTYYGSFVNNSMSSQRAVIKHGNGDKFKGQV